MSKPKILFVIPVSTGLDIKVPTAMWLTTMMNMKEKLSFEFNVTIIPSHSPAIGRNVGIKRSLEQDYTHLFFLDSDVVPHVNDVVDKMLSLDKDIVSGMYPLCFKDGLKLWSVQFDTPCGPDWVQVQKLPLEPFKSVGFGGGFILIKKEVLEKMPRPWFEFELDEDGMVSVGEDISFCRKLIDLGYELWVEPAAICSHYKTVDLLKEWGMT